MNVQAPEHQTSVMRVSQIVVGAYYMIVGTDLVPDKDKAGNFKKDAEGHLVFTRKPVPPQGVRILTAPHHGQFSVSCKVEFFCDQGFLEGGVLNYVTHLDLSDVNIPEHGSHDRHLERIPDATVAVAKKKMKAMNQKQNYLEQQADRQTHYKDMWE